MISEKRIMEIARQHYNIHGNVLPKLFARAIEREAYKRGQEDMLERAVKKCEEIETKYHRKWKKDYLPQDQGISNGASECAYDIRYLEIEEPK